MTASFSLSKQEEIKDQLFHAGIILSKIYGMQKMTISKLTDACKIAKGSFYAFYDSKEAFIIALFSWCENKRDEMFNNSLNNDGKLTVHEFCIFLKRYLYSEYDLMNGLTIDDYLWLKTHLNNFNYFDQNDQMKLIISWLEHVEDKKVDLDAGIIVNLIKMIYAMREHRSTFIDASIDKSIDLIIDTLETYIYGGTL